MRLILEILGITVTYGFLSGIWIFVFKVKIRYTVYRVNGKVRLRHKADYVKIEAMERILQLGDWNRPTILEVEHATIAPIFALGGGNPQTRIMRREKKRRVHPYYRRNSDIAEELAWKYIGVNALSQPTTGKNNVIVRR